MLRYFRPTVYAQLDPDRLAVRDVRTGRAYAARPIGAVLAGPARKVVRAGDDALTASAGRPLEIVNPFKHPRVDPAGGFTEIEIRALHELGRGAGASRVLVWHGRELLQRELLGLRLGSGGKLLA